MFGRYPRLSINVRLALDFPEREVVKDKSKYIQALRQRLSAAYWAASAAIAKPQGKQKRQYEKKARHAVILPGDLVLVQKVAFEG